MPYWLENILATFSANIAVARSMLSSALSYGFQEVAAGWREILDTYIATLEELGTRWRALQQFKVGEELASFGQPGPEEGVVAWPSRWLAEQLGVEVATAEIVTSVAAVLIVAAIVFGIVAAAKVALTEYDKNDAAYRDYLSRIQGEIFSRGGAYQGMPPDLGRTWTPGPAEQERLNRLYNLTAGQATSGGAGDMSDDATPDWVDLITSAGSTTAPPPAPVPQAPKTGAVGVAASTLPNTSSWLDDAALQRARLRSLQGGNDVSEYNNLVQQNGQQIRNSGRDPGSSVFFPQGQKSK
jgi:hypothetical protein